MMLDCPPCALEHVRNPKVTLWITEGVRKADALASVGLRAITLLGDRGWRGTNETGGKTALEDLVSASRSTAARSCICFDSDAFQKPAVHAATETLGRGWRLAGPSQRSSTCRTRRTAPSRASTTSSPSTPATSCWTGSRPSGTRSPHQTVNSKLEGRPGRGAATRPPTY